MARTNPGQHLRGVAYCAASDAINPKGKRSALATLPTPKSKPT